MYLAELELQGFKSFAQKTHIRFDSGITAIVGPNGCGKSNIVDALRWVLGEQRPTLLRSSAMTNVIFNGTSTKKPQGFAEVSVTINNNRGVLPTEFNDVTITRRLFRSGDSEYLLNNVSCRLKDIIDLFMDTGMGSNAYSVIELKMVEEILTDKNNDRRRLFEEAAGVTKYKEKRKQTLRKLEETRTDLQRVDDILVEIRKNVRSLHIQAGRAQRAREYQTDLKKLDLALSKHEYTGIQNELKPLMERVIHAEQEKEDLGRQLEQLEQQALMSRQTLVQKEADQLHAQRLASRIGEQIVETDTSVKIDQEKITSEEHVIRQFEEDVTLSENDIKEFNRQIKSSEDRLQEAVSALEIHKEELEAARLVFESSRQEVLGVREAIESVNKQYNEVNQRIQALQGHKIRLESRLESMLEESARIVKQIASGGSDISQFKDQESQILFELDQAREAREQAEYRREEAGKQRDDLNRRQNELKDRIRASQSKLDAVRAEISLLENLARSNEAYPGSVRYLKENKARFHRITTVSEVFTTKEEHAVALESALGEAVNFLITDSLKEAFQVFELLKKEDKGKVTIIPLDQISSDYPVHPDALYHQVQCDKAFEPVRKLLLGSVLLCQSIEDAAQRIKGKRLGAVTPEGDVIDHEFYYRSGSTHKNTGIRVGMKDKIEKLARKAGTLEQEIETSQAELVVCTKKLSQIPFDSLAQRLKETDVSLREIENKSGTLHARKTVYEKNLRELEERKVRSEEVSLNARKELEQIEPELNELLESLDDIIKIQVEKRSELERKDESRQRAQSKLNEVQLIHQQHANTVENIRKDIERAQTGIAGVKKRLEVRAQNATESKDRILALKQQIKQHSEDLVKLHQDKKKADENLKEAEDTTSKQRGKINQLDEDLRDVRRRKDVNLELVHHLTMAKDRFDLQAKSISDHVWESYSLLMDQVSESMPEDSDPATIKETISNLRERLKNIGDVNPLAIQEYDEEKERLNVFEKQIADLAEAEEKLIQTIEEINQTANERFTTTFTLIRQNFKKVFNSLFEDNDHCDILLDPDNDDPLEQKINIIANPKGKRPSNIEQLSGGEKTLTAIALLFAIYLVKPSPFCVLDEVDAPLDDANVERFTSMIRDFSADTQFIIITHNKKTMEKSEMLYGVTMPEVGISRLVAVKMNGN